MKLRNQGPVQPAPEMTDYAGALVGIIESWPGVASFTHWRLGSPGTVDGAEFHVADGELGHIHLDATGHILLNQRIAALVVQKGLGRTPSWSNTWISQPVRSSADVSHAAWLFGLAYGRLRGVSDDEVIEQLELANAQTDVRL
ncbi:luciferase family protein [Sphingomonas sp. PP-CE-1G-424]|uniref:luciferase domain-containing protein n=1 Tax=Sphingomonas sp. PP-CE-1G-424 TaxID=2135658 RepID=UPI0010551E7F|nr:luciferase family protein [Sphingomonas sp. PP-CE-1G-424]TCP65592.1 hypothetical protein C8J43_11029 [Sphingomonas sp. PP-CE-1G-424]